MFQPDLIIFDCDGVLVDSEYLASNVLAQLLQKYGVDYDGADCRRLFTGSSLSSVEKMVQDSHKITLPDHWMDELREEDRRVFEKDLKAISGVKDTLEGLKACKTCVASSGRMEKITHSLKLTGLYEHLAPHLFSAQMVEKGKPAPDLFLHAANEMNIPASQCLVIEDSIVGVTAGKAAGMTVFGFIGGSHCDDPDYKKDLINAGADQVFENMSDLISLLK